MKDKHARRVNLRRKVLLILCVVLSLTIIGNFVISAGIVEKAQVSAFDREAFATTRGLQININNIIEKSFLPYTDIVNCEPVLDSFVENNEYVLYTYTTDANGAILYSSENAVEDGISSEELGKIVASGTEERIEDKKNEILYYILPLYSKNEVRDNVEVSQVGILVVAYPRTCITDPLNRLYAYNAVLASITFSCSFLLIFLLLTKWVTRPLQMLDEAIQKVSKKGFEGNSLNIRTNDEIGQITQSFNDMLEKLAVTTVSQNYVNSILLNMSEALFVIDKDKCIEKVNDAATNLLGYERNEMQGQLVDLLYAENEDNPFKKDNFIDVIADGISRNRETEFVDKNGKNISVSVNWSTIKDGAGNISKYVCTARDITDIKKAQSIVMYQANYDQLTGLSNRYNLVRSINKMLCDTNKKHVFIVIDLDKFKMVNDICGHSAGDKLLKQIAYMLRNAVDEYHLVARLGGDEFAIIMYDTDINQATEAMERLLKNVRSFSFMWGGKAFDIGMSIGAFEINQDGLDELTVFNAADRACYVAKKEGGNRLHVYTDEDEEIAETEEASMISIITEAFENNGFFLEYQSIMPLDDKDEVNMYEVLLRLRTKEGDVLVPEVFWSAVERYNKLLLLDKWVIHNFCKNYHKNAEKLLSGNQAQFNINLSRESLSSEQVFEFICQEFEKYEILPNSVCFGVAENCVISNLEDATTFINKLKDIGCKFAINNFGVGISSFMYLRLLPVDTIKINGGVIGEIDKSQVDLTIVKSINEIAHLLNITTIAECVQNKNILEKVRDLGIDYAQSN